VIATINVITCIIFDMLTTVEKKHTVNEETTGQFVKILMMQFTNIALVVLIVNMQLVEKGKKLFGFLPIFSGAYPDFNS